MGVLVVEDEDPWIPPPPKKKWIRHYLSGEIPKDFGAFTSASPPASPPPAPSTPPPTPILAEESSGSSHTAVAQELRRRVGSGTREVHNKLEKNRRAHLKECFELLKKQLPPAQDEKKSSNLSILHSALRHIQSLKRKERDYEHEMERLAREKIASQQRLSALKKELSVQWDHIDFNAILPVDSLLPEVDRIKSRTSNSTSTASEPGHMSEDDSSFAVQPCNKCHSGSSPPHLQKEVMPFPQQQDSCVAMQVTRGMPPALTTPVVSPIHLTSNHQRHCQATASPKSPVLPSSPLLLRPQQPLALTVHPTHHHSSLVLSHAKCCEHDAKVAVSSSTSATVTVPTIHIAGGQHPVAYLSPASAAHGELPQEGTIASSGKFGDHNLSPAVAITGGSIALSNGVVASAAVSLASSQSARPISLAHSPTSGATTAMLSTGIHGANSTPISALPTHLTSAGIAHLVAPIGGGHAALVTGSATHSLMAPLALVSSTGRPVAAHILGTSSPGPVAGKVMASGASAALPLLKPVTVGGQLPLMNAQYLTAATALGGLAHLVKPLVVVSSAPSNHSSSLKLPSSPPQ